MVHGKKVIPFGIVGYYLDADGKPIKNVEVIISPSNDSAGIDSFSMPFMYAISLLHCKNTEIVDAKESKKARLRRQKPDYPDVVYKQLVVNPMGSQKRVRSESGDRDRISESITRLHICRGHFKDYRFGKGLFGKYHDIYWWDHQVRGSSDYGVLCKTYRVDAT